MAVTSAQHLVSVPSKALASALRSYSVYDNSFPHRSSRLSGPPPNAGQYHLAPAGGVFHGRKIYNKAVTKRYGCPTSLEDYVTKAQMMDYEATRAEFEAFAARQNASPPATGVVYWMLNSAWPRLHWQLFDYYLRPAGAYFGAKVGSRPEHVGYDYESRTVYLINHFLHSRGSRRITADLVDVNGTSLLHREVATQTTPITSKAVLSMPEIGKLHSLAFLRLTLFHNSGAVLSRNVYWLTAHNDVLDWGASNWYTTPVTSYADFTALRQIAPAAVAATTVIAERTATSTYIEVKLENQNKTPAFFLRLAVVDSSTGEEIAPVFWSDNYVTLFPKERLQLQVEIRQQQGWMITLRGGNVPEKVIGCG